MADVYAALSHKVRQPRLLLLLLLPPPTPHLSCLKVSCTFAPCSGVPVPCWCWIHDNR
jgi:hypothetical protein